ncbi:histidinol dehydrogenase [uncultured Imperialibacter sp.]|uniref:histidinol dehydrogenase n=1 Tax=uncultured Imperialibacter sp. TaxID=1672639 RepID=UPI0030D8B5F0|tara:strand:+ start:127220 stop:128521 length:1302 start_codon:yes stop_codon:yes gene_type:complete
MQLIYEPPRKQWLELTSRPAQDPARLEKVVKPILEKVKRNGDMALRKFALEYDHVELDDLFVTEEELLASADQVGEELKAAIHVAKENIEKFHLAQKESPITVATMPGVVCRRKSIPVNRVGLYVPGGTAPLFSTALMLGIPAKIAGCKEIIIASPTGSMGQVNATVLYVAHLLGIKKILKIGGAQAIAALAYGTESVPKVDKIFGPGNQYVTAAKQMVSRDTVAIDMPAGPSEVLVFADKHAEPSFVAADLLSQAEHGADSQVILVTSSKRMVDSVAQEVERQLATLPRKAMAAKALENSRTIYFEDKITAMDYINMYGPEHLILALRDADRYAEMVENAGSVFIGNYTPESAGDYASGTNHTLPTNGWARAMAGVSVDSFVKKVTFQKITPEGLQLLGPSIEAMAAAEKLDAHKMAVTLRLQKIKEGTNEL